MLRQMEKEEKDLQDLMKQHGISPGEGIKYAAQEMGMEAEDISEEDE